MAGRTIKTDEPHRAATTELSSELVSGEQEFCLSWDRERLISLLFRTGIHLQAACDRRFREFGITAQDAALLLRCAEAGATTQGNLALAVGRDKSKITRFVDRLEPKGLLSRRTKTQDRRLTIIRVTSRGKRLVPLLKARLEQVRNELFHGVLDMDIAQLELALAMLEANAAGLGMRKDMAFQEKRQGTLDT